MFIDIHVHTRKVPGPLRNGKPAYATPQQLIERYDKLGIEKAVILPGVNPECAYVPQSNEEVHDIPKHPVRCEGAVPKLMRKYPNLYGDLSAGSGHNALARDEDYATQFINEFQDRLLFGTDICAPDTPTPLVDFLLKLRDSERISEQVFAKVARENAIKLLS